MSYPKNDDFYSKLELSVLLNRKISKTFIFTVFCTIYINEIKGFKEIVEIKFFQISST